tara:strand:+ start:331 stop:603 length:273 start_codon:yes stop_codon:yes gene_type:complete
MDRYNVIRILDDKYHRYFDQFRYHHLKTKTNVGIDTVVHPWNAKQYNDLETMLSDLHKIQEKYPDKGHRIECVNVVFDEKPILIRLLEEC